MHCANARARPGSVHTQASVLDGVRSLGRSYGLGRLHVVVINICKIAARARPFGILMWAANGSRLAAGHVVCLRLCLQEQIRQGERMCVIEWNCVSVWWRCELNIIIVICFRPLMIYRVIKYSITIKNHYCIILFKPNFVSEFIKVALEEIR